MMAGLLNTWHLDCPGFPSREEAETAIKENIEFIDMLKEEGLIHWVSIADCPQGSYIQILHGSERQITPILRAMDEFGAREEGINRFFGIPFLLVNG